jgi:hypothetical protein
VNFRKIITAILLGFVFVSIGFALGRQVGLRRLAGHGGFADGPATAPARGDKVVVYYMHPAMRCVTCNTIEKLARQAVQEGFAQDIRSGKLEWRTMGIEDDETLAKRYGVASSTVVVVRFSDGKELGHQRLDEVWELVDKPAELVAFVTRSVRAALAGATTKP